MMQPVIFIFDMDGVCVQPGGYRTALRQTTTYFFKSLNMEILLNDESIPELFESIGITSEWDMIPLTMIIALEAVCARFRPQVEWKNRFDAAKFIAEKNLTSVKVDFEESIKRIGQYLDVKIAPSEAILSACSQDALDARPFPCFSQHPYFRSILHNTRLVECSQTTCLFQNYVLGNRMFESVYGLPALVQKKSMLTEYDVSLVSDETRQTVIKLAQEDLIKPVILTARPSRLPSGSEYKLAGCSPEAEMAAEVVGFQEFPMIGYGKIKHLAKKMNRDVDSLVKPAPAQALAAIAAALFGDEMRALDWTAEILSAYDGILPEPNRKIADVLPSRLQIHVFEDSTVGIQAIKNAISILQTYNIEIDLHSYGISTHVDKQVSLKAVGSRIFPDVNQAVTQALLSIKK